MAEGDIWGAINTFEFDSGNGEDPYIIHVSGDVYAIAYGRPGDYGTVKTLSITDGGIIGAVIDSLELDSISSDYFTIIHISGDVYAVSYKKGNDGTVKTLSITDGGTIGAVIDTLIYYPSFAHFPHMAHVSGEIYVAAYRRGGGYGEICSFTIHTNGQIEDTIINSLIFAPPVSQQQTLIRITNNVIAIVSEKVGSGGYITTVPISDAGVIGDHTIDTLRFETAHCTHNSIIHVSGNVYAIAYTGVDQDGFLKTVTVHTNGAIDDTVIDTLEFDTVFADTPDIIHVSGNVYAIAYCAGDGYIKTVTIANDGTIGDSVIDTFRFDWPRDAYNPKALYISNDVYAIAYTGRDDDGFVKTVGIETIIPTGGGGGGSILPFAKTLQI